MSMLLLGSSFTSNLALMFPFLLAQEDGAAAAGLAFGQIVGIIISYAVLAFFSMKIFEKCGIENPWFAWIPVLNYYATFQAGDEENPVLWTILTLVPCVNIVAIIKLVIAWIKIADKINKSPLLLLLCLIPLGIFFVFGYYAFG